MFTLPQLEETGTDCSDMDIPWLGEVLPGTWNVFGQVIVIERVWSSDSH